jgi:hypothetical protein
MKILQLGNTYCRRDFEKWGMRSRHVCMDREIFLSSSTRSRCDAFCLPPYGWNPDLVLFGDDGRFPGCLGLGSLGFPLAWYAIDSHLRLLWHAVYAAAFDLIVVAQRSYVNSCRQDPTHQVVQWLPLFCDAAHDRWLIPSQMFASLLRRHPEPPSKSAASPIHCGDPQEISHSCDDRERCRNIRSFAAGPRSMYGR